MSNLTLHSSGVDPDTAQKIWEVYEATGNIAECARATGLPYHRCRKEIMSDQIRQADIQAARAEAYISRWEVAEARSANLSVKMIDILEGMLAHIQNAQKHDTLTEMLDHRGKPMTPTAAYQWLLATKQLDAVVKLGFMSSKTTESMRQVLIERISVKKVANQGDPSEMTDDEIMSQIQLLQDQGLDVPWGVRMWMEAQGRNLVRAGDTPD